VSRFFTVQVEHHQDGARPGPLSLAGAQVGADQFTQLIGGHQCEVSGRAQHWCRGHVAGLDAQLHGRTDRNHGLQLLPGLLRPGAQGHLSCGP